MFLFKFFFIHISHVPFFNPPCTLEPFVELLVLIDLKIFVYELHFPNGAKRKMFLYLSGELVIEY